MIGSQSYELNKANNRVAAHWQRRAETAERLIEAERRDNEILTAWGLAHAAESKRLEDRCCHLYEMLRQRGVPDSMLRGPTGADNPKGLGPTG